MSYATWTIYGYGMCVEEIKHNMIGFNGEEKLKRVQNILHYAPKFEAEFNTWVDECTFDNDEDIIDAFENDNCYRGLGAILLNVLREYSNIDFELCDDYNGSQYILLLPFFAWGGYKTLTAEEQASSQTDINNLFNMFSKILCDKKIHVDYCDVENGG